MRNEINYVGRALHNNLVALVRGGNSKTNTLRCELFYDDRNERESRRGNSQTWITALKDLLKSFAVKFLQKTGCNLMTYTYRRRLSSWQRISLYPWNTKHRENKPSNSAVSCDSNSKLCNNTLYIITSNEKNRNVFVAANAVLQHNEVLFL